MADTKTLTLKVVGQHAMDCGGCERAIEFTLLRLAGVRKVKANHKTQRIEIDLASDEAALDKVKSELDWLGYQVQVL